jgi:hypothetical protein
VGLLSAIDFVALKPVLDLAPTPAFERVHSVPAEASVKAGESLPSTIPRSGKSATRDNPASDVARELIEALLVKWKHYAGNGWEIPLLEDWPRNRFVEIYERNEELLDWKRRYAERRIRSQERHQTTTIEEPPSFSVILHRAPMAETKEGLPYWPYKPCYLYQLK